MSLPSESQPLIGVLYHAIGGLAAASFYLPYRRVRGWSWESYWITGGAFSWILAPIVAALILVPDTFGTLRAAARPAIFHAWLLGALWGFGGLTFGLSMRYLGIALGYAVALGFCAAFGTLVPPLWDGSLGALVETTAGRWTLFGVAVSLFGIACSGAAGLGKERDLTDEKKRETVKEFALGKGIAIAAVCGLLSACMSFAFRAGSGIVETARARGTDSLWAALPLLVVVLLGGFTTNCIWCLFLNARKRTFGEYAGHAADGTRAPVAKNLFFCALAGIAWYLQFFFYSMGESRMGAELKFSSWTLHMATIIIFSTGWGILLHEWRGVSTRTKLWVSAGLGVLILSTVIVGFGNHLAALSAGH
jgi:L-rhamnose-H+ transport protein